MARGRLYRASITIIAWPIAAVIAYAVLLWAVATVVSGAIAERLLAFGGRNRPL